MSTRFTCRHCPLQFLRFAAKKNHERQFHENVQEKQEPPSDHEEEQADKEEHDEEIDEKPDPTEMQERARSIRVKLRAKNKVKPKKVRGKYKKRRVLDDTVKEEPIETAGDGDYQDANDLKQQRRLLKEQRRAERQLRKRESTKDQPYKCVFCQHGFKTLSSRWCHYRTQHEGEKPYKCKECGEQFEFGRFLMKHRRESHKLHVCPLCPHESRYISEQEVSSSHKSQQLVVGVQLAKHVDNYHKRCKHCSEIFKSARQAEAHARYVHNTAAECEMCRLKFDTNHALKRHLRFHMKELKYTCRACRQSFCMARTYALHESCCEKLHNSDNQSRVHPSLFVPIMHGTSTPPPRYTPPSVPAPAQTSALQIPSSILTPITEPSSTAAAPVRIKCPTCDTMFDDQTSVISHLVLKHGWTLNAPAASTDASKSDTPS